MSKHKIYLGDSVYADTDGYGVELTTENGFGPSNTIYLEPPVYEALVDWVNRLRASIADVAATPPTSPR